MKPFQIAIYGFMLLLAGWAVAQTADISGTWQAKTVSARGTAEQTITFQQTGDSFTGEMITSQGKKEPVLDGVVVGNAIEFSVERMQPSGEKALVPYKGTVTGNEIQGTFFGATGRDVEWTATRNLP